MVTKFSRKELERLGCTDEEIELVMKYQKKLPILSENNSTQGFCVDARKLYEQLGVGRQFSDWMKQNIKEYVENVDYKTFSRAGEKPQNGRPSKEYMLMIDFAKEISMFAGRNSQASKELKENSRMARKYFILMENIVQENKEWLIIRDPEKTEYNNMCEEINAWNFRIWHKSAGRSDYAVEANGLNKIVTGLTSQELKIKYGCPTNDLLRDYLKKDHNEELLFLEKQNQVLLRMDMGYTERMNMLTKMYEVTFKKTAEKIA